MNKGLGVGVKPASSLAHSSYYFGHWKCTQAPASGAVVDSSGNSRNLTLGAQLDDDGTGTGIYEDNPGYITMPGKQDAGEDGLELSAVVSEYVAPNWADTGLLIAASMNQAAASQTTGTCDICGSGGSSVAPGWRLVINGAGAIQLRVHDGTNQAFNTLVGDIDDGADHHVVVAYDGPTDTVSTWVDTASVGSAAAITGAAAILNAATQALFAIGTTSNAAAALAAPMIMRDLHVLHIPGGIPANIGYLVKRLYQNRYAPLTPNMLGA